MIVGLGNPGPKYEFTRHNLGFLALDTLAVKLNTRFAREKHDGLMAEAVYRGEKLLLVKPMTFMNLSGECVAKAARNKVHEPADVLVVVDDVHLPLGRLRFRGGGSAGGHNGLKSIIERLGTPAFHRMRMGVGNTGTDAGLADHVLAKFKPDEYEAVAEMRERGTEGILVWIAEGLDAAMNRFNR